MVFFYGNVTVIHLSLSLLIQNSEEPILKGHFKLCEKCGDPMKGRLYNQTTVKHGR